MITRLNIADDVPLLDLMESDMKSAPEIYQATGPTAKIVSDLAAELRARPLAESLRTGSRLLNTIGAVNYSPLQQMHYNYGRQREHGELTAREQEVMESAARILWEKRDLPLLPYELSLESLERAAFCAAELYGKATGARSPREIGLSAGSEPMYAFEIDGKRYSYLYLYYYMRYAYCCQFVDFDKVENIVEMGSGSGRTVEIVKKLHPHINFYLLDLPPQLYVCRQLVRSVFAADLVDYNESRRPDFTCMTDTGRIATLLPHQLERIRPQGRTLAWNSMVYCIMPRPKVEHYLRFLAEIADLVYIIEPMPNRCDAEYGIDAPVDYDDYARCLSAKFVNVDRSAAMRALAPMVGGWGEPCDTMWLKRTDAAAGRART